MTMTLGHPSADDSDPSLDWTRYPRSWIDPDEPCHYLAQSGHAGVPVTDLVVPSEATRCAPAGDNEVAHPDSIALRPEEVAERCRLSRARIYELMASGELPSITIGRSRRVPLTALIGFLRDRQS